MPLGNGKKIRVGIMCDGLVFKRWQAQALNKLMKVDSVEITVLIINGEAELPQTLGCKIKRLLSSNSLFFIYDELVKKRMNSAEPVDMSPLFSQIPQIICRPVYREDNIQILSEKDIEVIRDYNLDVILQFGFKRIGGKVLDIPQYGIWVFNHDENRWGRGPSCFWEIYKGESITETALLRLTNNLNKALVLKRGYFSTIDSSYSNNKDKAFFLSTDWPACVCKDILIKGRISYLGTSNMSDKVSTYPFPSNRQMLIFFSKIIYNSLVKQGKRLFISEVWNAGVINKPIYTFLEEGGKPDVQWLPNPEKGFFRADPFALVDDNGKLVIMIEELNYERDKGYIIAIQDIGFKDGKLSFEKTVINKFVLGSHIHMSYPYLIEYEGEIFCVPEANRTREVSLYRAEQFPSKWGKVCTIIKDFPLVDPTICQYNGYWWLFGTDQDSDPQSKLYIWYAKDLFGPWIPHRANPVKDDVRSGRPGGTPFMYKGQLYRPAQDCTKIYGGKVVLNRIIKLTTTEFMEETVAEITPYENSPYPHGLHTISAVGNKTVIDSKREVFDIHCFRKKIKAKLKGKFQV